MPKRASRADSLIDDFADAAVEQLFERGAEMLRGMRERRIDVQVPQVGSGSSTQLFCCAACKKDDFALREMQMVDPHPKPDGNRYGLCLGCFKFVWDAAKEKMAFLSRRAGQQATNGPQPQPRAAPKMLPPWEVLGIKPDATVAEIRKAYRTLAAQFHDDRFNGADVTEQERAFARAKFLELTRCQDAMLKVRGVTGNGGGQL